MIIASGTSQRHVASLADRVVEALKSAGYDHVPIEGKEGCEWVLVDAGNLVIHLFHPEMRRHYNLEKMWAMELPQLEAAL
jgi:ribosome-associated protein